MSSQEAEYRVVYPEAIRAALTTFIAELQQAGWDKALLATLLRTLDERLKKTPGTFGEPLYTLPGKNLKVTVGFVRPFAVQFGIREEDRIVFVRKLILMTTQR